MITLLTKEDLQQQVNVLAYALNKEGLTIRYSTPGKELFLTASPQQALPLLKKVKLIEDYRISEEAITITCLHYRDAVDLEGNPLRFEDKIQCSWEEYITHYELSQYWALQLAIAHECDKYYGIALEVFNDIPDLVKKIAVHKKNCSTAYRA